jgi:hypothetical protein
MYFLQKSCLKLATNYQLALRPWETRSCCHSCSCFKNIPYAHMFDMGIIPPRTVHALSGPFEAHKAIHFDWEHRHLRRRKDSISRSMTSKQEFLNSNANRLETNLLVNGVWDTQVNTSLPTGFDFSKLHTIRVEKSGSTYKYFVDMMLKETKTSTKLGAGKVGYLSSDEQQSERKRHL